jgi:hypothetical protein
MKIKIELTGTDGKKTKSVEVAPTGASIGEICKAAGIDPKDKDFSVNGKPATEDTHVGKDDVLAAKGKSAPVAVSARPQGS